MIPFPKTENLEGFWGFSKAAEGEGGRAELELSDGSLMGWELKEKGVDMVRVARWWKECREVVVRVRRLFMDVRREGVSQ